MDFDNFSIKFLQKVGNDNGFSIIYGKNLQSIKAIEDWSNVVTKLYPEGPDGIMLPEVYIESDIQYEQPYTRTIKFDFETSKEDEDGNSVDLSLEEQYTILRQMAKEHKTSFYRFKNRSTGIHVQCSFSKSRNFNLWQL